MKPIVLIHGYSSEGKTTSSEEIYGNLPADLRKAFGNSKVLEIDLARWISLNDGITIDDITFALERAVTSPTYKHLLTSGFHVVIHSTGSLVIRNWIRLFERKPSPIENLVHLAGANFGSGLAHIGQGQLAKWGRRIFQGLGRGVRLLDELEFGSWKTLDLQLHFLNQGSQMWEDYQVQEFCLIGSQTLGKLRPVPIRYVKEDSADNTVRTSACNLNFNYVIVKPTPEAYSIKFGEMKKQVESRLDDEKLPAQRYELGISELAAGRVQVPFAILYETSHFGKKIGIVDGTDNRSQIIPLITAAISTPYDAVAYAKVSGDWDNHTTKTFQRVGKLKGRLFDWDKQEQYEGHAQLIFRLRDQFGGNVENYDITFKSVRNKKQTPLEKMIEDKHENRNHPGTVTYYLRVEGFNKKRRPRRFDNLLANVASLDFEISAYEPKSGDIDYLPLTIDLNPTLLKTLIQPFRTTLIDVTLLRLPTKKVFALSKSKK